MGRKQFKKILATIGAWWHHITNTLATPLLGKPSDAPIWRVFFFARTWTAFKRRKYTKPALTHVQQLDLLRSRGLGVPDPELAIRWLSRVSYYRLSAYLYPFRLTGADDYRPGTTFEQIAEIYNFDRKLRILLIDAIERVEVWLRAAVTYELAHRCGPFGYMRKVNFPGGFDHKKFCRTLRDEHLRSKEKFVEHYREKYTGENHLPIWMATELLTFGTVSHLYASGMPLDSKKTIAAQIGVSDSVLTNWMLSIGYVRNLCAHHSRVWNRKLSISPKLPREWRHTKGVPNHKTYAVIVVLQAILDRTAPNSSWLDRVHELIEKNTWLDLSQMGFPTDWKHRSPWKERVTRRGGAAEPAK